MQIEIVKRIGRIKVVKSIIIIRSLVFEERKRSAQE